MASRAAMSNVRLVSSAALCNVLAAMKILHCASALQGGGAETQLAYLAAQQVRSGHRVHIAHPAGQEIPTRIRESGACLHPLRQAGSHDPFLLWRVLRTLCAVRPQVVQTWHLQMDVVA